MKRFHQPGDLWVNVQDGLAHYADKLANFMTDFGEAPPPLPAGVDERLYDQGKRHALIAVTDDAHDVIDGGPREWDFGDRSIAAIDDLLIAQNAREVAAAAALAAARAAALASDA